MDDDREPPEPEPADPVLRNPVPDDMPTDPPLVPRPFAGEIEPDEE